MITVIIPIAGQGQRMIDGGFDTPKPLIEVNGQTLIEHSVKTLGLDSAFFVFVTRPFEDLSYNIELQETLDRLEIYFGAAHVESGSHLGSAHSSLYAESLIKSQNLMDSPLIITNGDQILKWDADKFVKFTKTKEMDGAVVLYKSTNPKNSYAKINDGVVTSILEKTVVGDDALIGVHYWKHAKDFFDSARQLVADNTDGKESYVSETYNYLIKNGKTILPYWLSEDEEFIPLGTPEDIESYLNDNS